MKTATVNRLRIFAVYVFVSSANLTFALADTGNSHGGGGFTEVDPPASISQITDAIKSSRLEITAWFHSVKSDYQKYLLTALPSFDAVYFPRRMVPTKQVDPGVTFARFFPERSADIFVDFDQMQIEIAEHGPCRSTIGEHVDGSFNPKRPHNICISAFQLAKKLKLSDFKAQTESLIVHEMTHMRGGNEPEAVYVQTIALNDFTKTSLIPIDGNFEEYKSKICPELVDMSSWMMSSTNPSEINHLAQAFAIEMRALRDSLQAQSFNLMIVDFALFDKVYQYAKLARILANYACSQDPALNPAKRDTCQKDYEGGFSGTESIDLSAYRSQDPPDGYEYYAAIPVSKIKNHDEWLKQMKVFQPLIEQIADSVEILTHQKFRTLGAL